jgi:hypothetical protein
MFKSSQPVHIQSASLDMHLISLKQVTFDGCVNWDITGLAALILLQV